MKKILALSFFAAIAFAGCKKQENTVSKLVNVSYPTGRITSGQYFSFPLHGGPLPTVNSIHATAYDSFYHESIVPVVDASHLSNLAPGLYVATVSAKNSNGFTGYAYVYVAITDVPDSMDISGFYLRQLGGSPSPSNPVFITKKATGLYLTSNVGGVDTGTQKTSIVPAVFAITDFANSTLDFGKQPTSAGTLTASGGLLKESPVDTTISYSISLSGFGSQVRTFVKQ